MILIRNTLKCMHKMHNSKYNNDLVIIDLLINDFNRYLNCLNFALINLILPNEVSLRTLIIQIFINTLLLTLGFQNIYLYLIY